MNRDWFSTKSGCFSSGTRIFLIPYIQAFDKSYFPWISASSVYTMAELTVVQTKRYSRYSKFSKMSWSVV